MVILIIFLSNYIEFTLKQCFDHEFNETISHTFI